MLLSEANPVKKHPINSAGGEGMAFVTINCPHSECNGVLVLGIDERGNLFAPRKFKQVNKQAMITLYCPVNEKHEIVVGFDHVKNQE
jgi:hypothetical protein